MSIGMTFLQVATGTFFVVTGYRKNFRPEVREKVIPFIEKQAHCGPALAKAVCFAELAGGLGLFVLPRLSALGLLPIMLMAYKSTIWPEVKAKQSPGDHWTKIVSNALCTPEGQLIIALIAILLG